MLQFSFTLFSVHCLHQCFVHCCVKTLVYIYADVVVYVVVLTWSRGVVASRGHSGRQRDPSAGGLEPREDI